ncbi:MAG: MBL fold metallo-hydrolase [Acidobacteriia bacterium]|nr:MBL fold metallo-hydrolase [Terriglobia bacterium]
MPERLIHKVIPVGLLQCNCSILGDAETHEAIVVDPGDEVDYILEILRQDNLKVMAIVSTHTHIDHVGGLAKLHRATGAPVLIHKDDLHLYTTLETQAQWIGVPTPEMVRIDDFVKEGDKLRWGGFAAQILHTPGHTQGSISLVVEPNAAPHPHDHAHAHPPDHAPAVPRLLAGDTLFQGSIGRTDLPGGSYPQIMKSIHEKLLVLPDEVVVIPGHGDPTTIGEEREHNPFLR